MLTKLKVSSTSAQVLELKLPISQKIITATCSSATYFRKLMPADKMAATIIPDKIRLFEDSPLPLDERYMTKSKVAAAPQKSKYRYRVSCQQTHV